MEREKPRSILVMNHTAEGFSGEERDSPVGNLEDDLF
jgi:hypothetical protein